MQFLITPYAKRIESFVRWENAFNEEELNWIQQKAKNSNITAIVGTNSGPSVDTSIRRSQVSWLNNNTDTKWIFEKLSQVVSQLNADYFNFDLTGFGEELQLTNYDQSESGMYGWHQDYNGKVSRKLSLTVQLTDPSEYEGGNLQILTSGEPVNVRKQRGLITVFPSYILHQVTPVTQGSRQSLVAWISGPAFK
jgi:PKHD-type hydroxylase